MYKPISMLKTGGRAKVKIWTSKNGNLCIKELARDMKIVQDQNGHETEKWWTKGDKHNHNPIHILQAWPPRHYISWADETITATTQFDELKEVQYLAQKGNKHCKAFIEKIPEEYRKYSWKQLRVVHRYPFLQPALDILHKPTDWDDTGPFEFQQSIREWIEVIERFMGRTLPPHCTIKLDGNYKQYRNVDKVVDALWYHWKSGTIYPHNPKRSDLIDSLQRDTLADTINITDIQTAQRARKITQTETYRAIGNNAGAIRAIYKVMHNWIDYLSPEDLDIAINQIVSIEYLKQMAENRTVRYNCRIASSIGLPHGSGNNDWPITRFPQIKSDEHFELLNHQSSKEVVGRGQNDERVLAQMDRKASSLGPYTIYPHTGWTSFKSHMGHILRAWAEFKDPNYEGKLIISFFDTDETVDDTVTFPNLTEWDAYRVGVWLDSAGVTYRVEMEDNSL